MGDRPSIPGSVSRRGEKYLAQLPPSMGRLSKIKDTEAEAWEWLRNEHARDVLKVSVPSGASVSVGVLIDLWFDTHPSLKESTRVNYRRLIDTHIKSHAIAALPIDVVKPMYVEKCLSDTPRNWTRVHVAKILGPFFDWAETNQFVTGNPFRRSQASRMVQMIIRTSEPKESTELVWTPDQLIAFIEHEPSPVYRDYWTTVALTGARRGEAIGLTWACTSVAKGYAWLEDNITTAGSEVMNTGTPKNWKRRKVYFGEVLGTLLEARKSEQDTHRSQCDDWRGDWVFDRRVGKGKYFHNGVHLAPATVTARFTRQSKELNLPPLGGPHGLRRTFATIADASGFRPRLVTELLGHTPDTTGKYIKPTPEELREAADRLANVILRR